MADFFTRGNVSYIDENYDEAIQHYTEALKASPRDATILSCRAAALLKNKKYMKAFKDANDAVALDPQHEVAYFRKGLACFEMEEYENAKSCFEQGMELKAQITTKDLTTYQRWIRKCNSELTSKWLCAFVCQLANPTSRICTNIHQVEMTCTSSLRQLRLQAYRHRKPAPKGPQYSTRSCRKSSTSITSLVPT